MRKTDWIAGLMWATCVVALEMIARGHREAWWGWLLYVGSAASITVFLLGRSGLKL